MPKRREKENQDGEKVNHGGVRAICLSPEVPRFALPSMPGFQLFL